MNFPVCNNMAEQYIVQYKGWQKLRFCSLILWYFRILCYFTVVINYSDEKQGVTDNVLILVTELEVVEGV